MAISTISPIKSEADVHGNDVLSHLAVFHCAQTTPIDLTYVIENKMLLMFFGNYEGLPYAGRLYFRRLQEFEERDVHSGSLAGLGRSRILLL